MSAQDLAHRIRRGDLRPEAVVEAHIRRVQRVDPALNALVSERFEAARAEAAVAGERVRAAHQDDVLPPLLGVPCTIKEFLAAEGLAWTAGIPARRGRVAERDATAVARIRAAGAIILGQTNMAEGGLWMEARNPLFGAVNNPWDPTRTAGGSSGGCGALVASGAVPFSLGADIGGSIRIPAAFCGTVGHKPSGRMVPTTGHLPQPDGEARALLCLGPLARHARDLLPLLRLLAGPDGHDPVVRSYDLAERVLDPRELTVYPADDHLGVAVWPAARRAVRRAARALERLGARVRPASELRLGNGILPWSAALMVPGSTGYAEILGDGERLPWVREILAKAVGRGRHSGVPLAVCLLEALLGHLPGDYPRTLARLTAQRAELEARLGPCGVILHPPWSRPAPPHRAALLTPFDFACTALFNALELPGTVVPVGFERHGLPIAVQIVGPRGADPLTIAVAGLLERELGGWVMADPREVLR
ncbi:MAG: amidase [Pseudomonadota bacterium]